MAYSADTFVADEQPTTAKWNKLWANDAAFNDGTGIANNAITANHISGFDYSIATTNRNPYTFSAYKSGGNQAISASTQTKISFQTERWDTNSNYDSVTNFRYTIPVTGYYLLNVIMQTLKGTSSTDNNCSLYKNGSLFRKGGNLLGGVYPQQQAIGLFQSTAADYWEGYFINVASTDSIESAATSSSFEGCMMFRT